MSHFLNGFEIYSKSPKLGFHCFFLDKRVPGRGLELRKPNKAVLCPLIIIILISYHYIIKLLII